MEFLQSIGFNLTLEFWIILCVLGSLFIIQSLYYFMVYLKPYSFEKKRVKDKGDDVELPPVSIVIASKNESENLLKNLPLILEQDYPNFEVIVINMGSTDETNDSLKQIGAKYPNLYHTFVPADAEDINNKKLALTLGIKAAKNEYLLFTEAYCRPNSNKWIEEFALEFLKGKDIVLGYNNLTIDKQFMLSGFVKYDNLIHQVKFLSMAIIGKPFMGVGRNMAYKKSLFFEEKGFSSVLKYYDGEDDLFINKAVKNRSVGVVVSADGITTTSIVDKYSVWKSLKSKYLNSKKYYRGASSLLFWLDSFTKFVFKAVAILSIIYGIISQNYAIVSVAALLLILHFLIAFYVINKISKMLEDKKASLSLVWYELIMPLCGYKFRSTGKRKR